SLATAGPLSSVRPPAEARSLTVSTAALIGSPGAAGPGRGRGPRPRLSAALGQQAHVLQVHALLEALDHVDQGQAGARRSGQPLHLDAGLAADPDPRLHADAVGMQLEVQVDAADRQGMAER